MERKKLNKYYTMILIINIYKYKFENILYNIIKV